MSKYKKKPLSELVSSAQRGNKEAKTSLGLLHELGLIVNSKAQEALNWYEQAAREGDAFAAISAAQIYRRGLDDIPANSQKADEFLKIAKDLGFDKPEDRVPKRNSSHTPTEAIIGKKVLIVDQDSSAIKKMRDELSNNGFRPFVARSMQELNQTLATHHDFYCFFVDITLTAPMYGQALEAIRRLKIYKQAPIVVVTDKTDPEIVKKAKAYKLSSWLLKPVNEKIFLDAAKKFSA